MGAIKNFLGKTRWRNVAMWVALVSLVLDIMIYSGHLNVTEKQEIEVLVQRGLEVLIGLGVLSNPTKPDSKGLNL